MVYHRTRRAFWAFRSTATKFLLSSLLLGVATVLLCAVAAAKWSGRLDLVGVLRGWGPDACLVMAALSTTKLAFGVSVLRHLRDRHHTPGRRTARLLVGPLLGPVQARIALALVGGALLPLLARAAASRPESSLADFSVLIVASFVMTLAAELLERYLFFTAVVAPRMPGGLGA
jgi:DMSO reductase anchor subunit